MTDPTVTAVNEASIMLRIAKILDKLDPATQGRTVAWLHDRYLRPDPEAVAQHHAEGGEQVVATTQMSPTYDPDLGTYRHHSGKE